MELRPTDTTDEHIEHLLVPYINGSLDPQASDQTKRHLAECEKCLDAFTQLKEVLNLPPTYTGPGLKVRFLNFANKLFKSKPRPAPEKPEGFSLSDEQQPEELATDESTPEVLPAGSSQVTETNLDHLTEEKTKEVLEQNPEPHEKPFEESPAQEPPQKSSWTGRFKKLFKHIPKPALESSETMDFEPLQEEDLKGPKITELEEQVPLAPLPEPEIGNTAPSSQADLQTQDNPPVPEPIQEPETAIPEPQKSWVNQLNDFLRSRPKPVSEPKIDSPEEIPGAPADPAQPLAETCPTPPSPSKPSEQKIEKIPPLDLDAFFKKYLKDTPTAEPSGELPALESPSPETAPKKSWAGFLGNLFKKKSKTLLPPSPAPLLIPEEAPVQKTPPKEKPERKSSQFENKRRKKVAPKPEQEEIPPSLPETELKAPVLPLPKEIKLFTPPVPLMGSTRNQDGSMWSGWWVLFSAVGGGILACLLTFTLMADRQLSLIEQVEQMSSLASKAEFSSRHLKTYMESKEFQLEANTEIRKLSQEEPLLVNILKQQQPAAPKVTPPPPPPVPSIAPSGTPANSTTAPTPQNTVPFPPSGDIHEWAGMFCPISHQGEYIIGDEGSWEALWNRVKPNEDNTPTVDFSTQMIACVFLGEQKGGGYQVRVMNSEYKSSPQGRILLIKYKRFPPPPGSTFILTVTQPYHIKVIPIYKGTIQFEEIE